MGDTSRRQEPNFTEVDGVALKEYLEMRIAAQYEYFNAKLESIDKADTLAAKRLDERLNAMNEFREAMGDLSNRMVTRDEWSLQTKRTNDDIIDLRKSRDEAAGKASQTSVIVSMLLGLAGLIVGVVGLLT